MSADLKKEAWGALVKKLENSQMSECGDFIVFHDNGYSIFYESIDAYFTQWDQDAAIKEEHTFSEYLIGKVSEAHDQYEA